ncbi:MAG: alpha/beta fold hydrolase [Methanomassiliicoccus sp.]|nr:alpha/beta fold hydrolase [Methanomassiliicoccus sp.]
MEIGRIRIDGPDIEVPGMVITPRHPVGSAVIAHGYGGCKEEQLGLAMRVAESGLTACAIDLRGHGEHPLPLDLGALDDVEAAIGHFRSRGRVVAIGHSLGGRLALISSADFAIGLSPPLDPGYCPRTQDLLRKLRSYRVKPDDPSAVFDLLRRLPAVQDVERKRTLIIYGSRDVPEIVEAGDALRARGRNAVRLEQAIHGDTYLLESAFAAVSDQLTRWFGPGGR